MYTCFFTSCFPVLQFTLLHYLLSPLPLIFPFIFENNSLHIASERGHTHIVDYLLKRKANINIRTVTDNVTPLMLACKENQIDCLRSLLYAGAFVYLKNRSGFNAVHYACQVGGKDVIAVGRGIDIADSYGIDVV